MFQKETFKSITNDDSKENGHPSLKSKTGSIKYDDEYQFHTGGISQRSSLQETESIMNLKFNQRTESTPQSQLQSKTSIFTGGLNTPRAASLVIPGLEDAQAIIDKLDQPKEILKAFEAYQPKNKDIDIVALKKSERSKIRKYKTSVYLGEFLNGKRHGQGIMIFTPLKIYEGDWENDVKHGKGFEILEKGSRYEGEYVNGKPEGHGKFVWGNGESYEGDWKNGVKHGSGVWKGTQGESYVGEWRHGKAEGHGVHTWKNGDKYEGEFKGFLKHGHGKEKFVNGDSYIGDYVNGKPEGFGEYFWANGCHYKGDFKNGLRHGKGTWTKGTGNADHYQGEWANDKKNGTGVYTWVSGNRYMGSYFDDIRHGYGEMYWVDGGVYKGFWERGIQHGEGKVIIPGKINTRGIFERNTFVDNIDEGGDTEKTEKGVLSSRRGDSSPKLNNQHAAAGILATPRGNVQIKPLMKKFGKTNEYSSTGNEQNRNNEFCLLPEIKTGKSSNNTSLLMQSQTTRRNSSSKESIKLEAQNALNKLMEQQGARRIKNLKTLAINDNLKKVSVLTKVK